MHPNPRKTSSIRQLGAVNIDALRAAVLAIPENVWEAENASKPNRYSALDQATHVVFRFVRDTDDWRASVDYPLWTEWRDVLAPVLKEASAAYGYARGDFPRVMLARLAPGAVIHPHRDANPAARWPHKVHVPLLTNEKCLFFVDGVAYKFRVGEAVEVNNLGVHAVTNEGESDRIHLIFEYYDLDQPPPDWVGAQGRVHA